MEDYEAELALLKTMGRDELRLHLVAQEGRHAADRLEDLGWELKQLREDEKWAKRMAKNYIEDYNDSQEESDLVAVEQYTELLQSYRGYRTWLLKEIKWNRESIRWLREEYRTIANRIRGQPKS